jgi:predicted amidohydrolase YtcJ
MHAIGDAAVEQGATMLKKALDAYPREDHRHGLIHVSFISDNAMKILEEYKIQVIGQPAFLELSMENYDFMYKLLGDRVFIAEPHNEFIKRGIMFSASSDAPVTIPKPLNWIHWMVNNPNEPHRLTLTDAIRTCTYNGYYSTFDEKERGSLEVGKIADMIILDRNPYETDNDKLKDIKVLKTYFAGKEYVKENKNMIKVILKGMINRKVKI